MKYSAYADSVKKYINKYFCKYKSKNRFKRMEYYTFKRRIYSDWYFGEGISFGDDSVGIFFNDWVDRSRACLIHMSYAQNSKSTTGEKLFTGFKPGHAIVINALRGNNRSAIKQLPILYKGGQ